MVKFAQLPKYEAYKDSGVEWLGEIPKYWNVRKLKYLLKEVNHRSEDGKENLLSVSQYTGVTLRSNKLSEGDLLTNAESLEGYKIVKVNDLVSNIMLAWNGSLGFSNYDGIVSPAYAVYRLNAGLDQQFFHYLLRTDLYKAEYKRQSTGVIESRLRLYTDSFYDIFGLLPSAVEQTLIANFLDQKTAQIDAAIAIKEQQIELLKERKQIIIQQAVTQGLDPNVPMKDSGVEWIGQIPEHWEIKRIKHVTSKIGSGVTPSGGGSTYLDEGIPLLRSQNIHFDRIDLTDVARISRKTYQDMSNSQVKKGDVLLNITGGSIGRCYFVDTDEDMNVNQHVCIVRPMKNIETVFLNAFLASEVGQGQICFFQQGGGREGLNFQALKNFSLALPPTAEQKKIVFFIEKESAELNELIELQRKQIQKLKEYKTTLINSAVTGKIKITPEMLQA